MKTRSELQNDLTEAFEGDNRCDIADAAANLARHECQAEIESLKKVLTAVRNTLPHIGGNPRSVDTLMSAIRKVVPEE